MLLKLDLTYLFFIHMPTVLVSMSAFVCFVVCVCVRPNFIVLLQSAGFVHVK